MGLTTTRAAAAMAPATRARLGLMMFLQYFIWGAWYVTLGTWLLRSLGFSGQQIGAAAGTTAIGAIVSPFLIGILADKSFATQKRLGVLHLAGGALLLVAARQQTFPLFYGVILLYSLCYMPTLSLTNSLAMRQMQDPQREFGPVRVLGSAGWIVAGLIIGGLGVEATSMPDVARAVLFFAAAEAGFVTGQTLFVCGAPRWGASSTDQDNSVGFPEEVSPRPASSLQRTHRFDINTAVLRSL
jgi:MFS family permease